MEPRTLAAGRDGGLAGETGSTQVLKDAQGPKGKSPSSLCIACGHPSSLSEGEGSMPWQEKEKQEGRSWWEAFSQRVLSLPGSLSVLCPTRQCSFPPSLTPPGGSFCLSLEVHPELSIWAHQDFSLKSSARGEGGHLGGSVS